MFRAAAKAYADFNELINDASVDAIVVMTPTKLHKVVVLAAARAGGATSVVIEGEAGIGKTALVNAWLSAHADEATTFVTTRMFTRSKSPPYR